MSFRKPCHMPFRKLIPHFTLTVHFFFFFSGFFTRFSIPDPPLSGSILDPGFPVNLEVLLINQRFQAIEFVYRTVPEKFDMGFLFYGHEVLQMECVILKYRATRINTSVTHT